MTFKALGCFIAFTAVTFKSLWNPVNKNSLNRKKCNQLFKCYLLSILFVTVFRMILDAVYVFVTFFTSGHWTRKRFLVWRTISCRTRMPKNTSLANHTHTNLNYSKLPASISHNEFRAKLLGCPWLIAVLRFGDHQFVLVHYAAHVGRCITTVRRRHTVAMMFNGHFTLQFGSVCAEEGTFLAGGVCYKAQHVAEWKTCWPWLLFLFNHLGVVVYEIGETIELFLGIIVLNILLLLLNYQTESNFFQITN